MCICFFLDSHVSHLFLWLCLEVGTWHSHLGFVLGCFLQSFVGCESFLGYYCFFLGTVV